MAINGGRVVAGGLAAGVWMTVANVVMNGMVLGKRMQAEMLAAAPSLAGKGMSTGILVARVLTTLVLGILIAWLYAAIRPRFGPGAKTSMIAAFVVWLCGFLFYLDWLYLGMMTASSYAIVSVVMAISVGVAGLIAGWLYKEGDMAARATP